LPPFADQLSNEGAILLEAAVGEYELASIESVFDKVAGRPGGRLRSLPESLAHLLKSGGTLQTIAAAHIGPSARPVRILVFDKSADANWQVAWHQDRTIAVTRRMDAAGFGHWTMKDGVHHVEPPFDIMERLITLRIHFDNCGEDNGPLKTIVGSHKRGRLRQADVGAIAKAGSIKSHPAKRGDVLLLKTTIIHASQKAKAPTRRRVLHIEFSPDARPGPLEWALLLTQRDQLRH
jgi:Phytanoyl-CoA dioxygenase (PhyH)